jgi:hypothetical protein
MAVSGRGAPPCCLLEGDPEGMAEHMRTTNELGRNVTRNDNTLSRVLYRLVLKSLDHLQVLLQNRQRLLRERFQRWVLPGTRLLLE